MSAEKLGIEMEVGRHLFRRMGPRDWEIKGFDSGWKTIHQPALLDCLDELWSKR